MSDNNITPDLAAYKVSFLVGSVGLYGEDTLREVAEQSKEVVAALNASPNIPVTIEWQPVLTDSDSILAAVRRANDDPNVVGVITWMHTFSPAKMWIRGLTALQKPLLHLATQANVAMPYESLDFDFMNLNQSAHGDREHAYILTRLRVPHKTVFGHATDPEVGSSIGWWTRAAVGWHDINHLRIARIGDNMRNVAVTEGDKTEAEAVFGVSVNTWGVQDLVAVIDDITNEDAENLAAQYDQEYAVVAELGPSGPRRSELVEAARIELGLRRFLIDGGFQAFTDTFEDLGDLVHLPGVAVQRLMADGYGFGPEGDWKTAALIRLAKVMGAGLEGGASLMEDYTYELSDGKQAILGAHMLEICPTLTRSTPSLEIHPLGIGGKSDPVRLVFDADPGPAVAVALTDVRDRFRLTANAVDIIPLERALPKLPVARALWQPRPDLRTSVSAWLAAGAAHHTVLTTAVPLEVFDDFARMAGTELLTIDESTDYRQFLKEIEWNSALYRLERGL